MELPKDVSITTNFEGEVELTLLKAGVNYTFPLEPNDAYNIGLALTSVAYEAQKRKQTVS